jgi:hypothetical protein
VPHVIFAAVLAVCAFLFALVEINIEGSAGWAANLPTWRIQNRLTDLLYGGRPLTGYHLWVQLFILAFAQLPFAFVGRFTWRGEALVAAFIILFWILEDFLWFVLNPAYGIRRFRKEHVWWHRRAWWLVAPREYFFMGPLAGVLYAYGRGLI